MADTMKELDTHVKMMEESLASGATPDPVTVMRLRLLVDALKAEMTPKRAPAPVRHDVPATPPAVEHVEPVEPAKV